MVSARDAVRDWLPTDWAALINSICGGKAGDRTKSEDGEQSFHGIEC